MELRIRATPAEQQALLDLPWDGPLAEWPDMHLVALPRGISRHVVRFTRLEGRVYALKEVVERLANHEYQLLRALERLDAPAAEAVGVVSGRQTVTGEPLDPILVTRHLQPKVVDSGHHTRRLLRLTGIDAQENQARRLLNDLDSYRMAKDMGGEDEEVVAYSLGAGEL